MKSSNFITKVNFIVFIIILILSCRRSNSLYSGVSFCNNFCFFFNSNLSLNKFSITNGYQNRFGSTMYGDVPTTIPGLETGALRLAPSNSEQKKNNYIYASRPERGLKLLLEKIWPEIVERNPDATLHICTYEHTMGLPDDVKKIHKEVEDLLEYSRNIKHFGHLPKRQFYELLSNCAYMVYPTEFPEISCINAIEAQYNGCLVVTTDKFAMSETVKSKTKSCG